MKRVLNNPIFMFILGVVVTTSIGIGVYAINASEITYNNTTVEGALNDLYNNIGGDIGESFKSSNYGRERLETMTNTLQLNKAGKYLCTAIHSTASGMNDSNSINSESPSSYLTISGCDNTVSKDNYSASITASGKLSYNESYFLTGLRTTTFECDVNSSTTVEVSTTATAATVVPWVMRIVCTEIE